MLWYVCYELEFWKYFEIVVEIFSISYGEFFWDKQILAFSKYIANICKIDFTILKEITGRYTARKKWKKFGD